MRPVLRLHEPEAEHYGRQWLLDLLDRTAPRRRYHPEAPDFRETCRWMLNELRLRIKEYAQMQDDGNPNGDR